MSRRQSGMAKDFYGLLGVDPGAGDDEIKKAYRNLARQYHPDANPGDPESERKFKEIAEAFSVLSDPTRRREYDTFGAVGASAGIDPFDIFASFFGGDPFGFTSSGGNGRAQGRDLLAGLELTMQDVVHGGVKTLEVPALRRCDHCSGSGAEPGSNVSECATCKGGGSVRSVSRSIFGNVMSSFTCPQCSGSGQRVESPCSRCRGEGRIQRTETVEVDVPAGVADGMQLRLAGKGQAGARGAAAGDLYVQFKVVPQPGVERRGDDLITTLAIPFTQAVLGGEVSIETFHGPVDLEIKPGTRPGDVRKVRSKGIPHLGGGGSGDLLVRFEVEVPSELPPDQEELLRKFAEARGEDVGDSKGVLGRLKSAFRA